MEMEGSRDRRAFEVLDLGIGGGFDGLIMGDWNSTVPYVCVCVRVREREVKAMEDSDSISSLITGFLHP